MIEMSGDCISFCVGVVCATIVCIVMMRSI